jgi:hypothetical protein
VPSPSVQWQESTNGATWSPIPGATSTTLTLPGVTMAQNGRLYRAVFENGIGKPATSEAARLTVTPPPAPPPNGPPTASFSWAPAVPHAGEPVSLVATASDASPIVSYAWDVQGNGSFAPGPAATSTTFATAGPHTVRLRVTAADGQSTTVARTIEVGAHHYPLIQPFPVVRLVGYDRAGGARITLLSVQAPVGSTVAINCRGHACPRKQVSVARSKTHKAGVVTLSFRRFERTFPAGTVLQIRVSFPGEVGKYTSFRIRRRRVPLRADACLDAVSGYTIGCPAP